MAIEKNELRRVMGHFATGVTVITSIRSSGELHGLTANAFTSVSLIPPLALVCVDKKAESYPCFEESKVFTVNVLASDQEALSRRFAVSGGQKFEGVSYKIGANGAPDPRRRARVPRVQGDDGDRRRRPYDLPRRDRAGRNSARGQAAAVFSRRISRDWRLARACHRECPGPHSRNQRFPAVA